MYFKITKKEIIEKFKSISQRIEEKRIQLVAIAKSYDAELFTYRTGPNEYWEFAGLEFKNGTPEGFCKPDSNGMCKPYQKNKEFWDKINTTPKTKIQEAMNLLNFPARGIMKMEFRPGENNHLFSLTWQLSKDGSAVVFNFPDEYSKNCKPIWEAPEYATEILNSEYSKLTEEASSEQ